MEESLGRGWENRRPQAAQAHRPRGRRSAACWQLRRASCVGTEASVVPTKIFCGRFWERESRRERESCEARWRPSPGASCQAGSWQRRPPSGYIISHNRLWLSRDRKKIDITQVLGSVSGVPAGPSATLAASVHLERSARGVSAEGRCWGPVWPQVHVHPNL